MTDVTPEQLSAMIPYAGLLGMEVAEMTPDLVVGRLAWSPERCTGANIMHGGAIMSLADTCGAMVAFLNMPEGAIGTGTIESKTNFLRPITEGTATATTRPLRKGRTTAVVETEITRDDGKLAAKVTQTQAFHYPR